MNPRSQNVAILHHRGDGLGTIDVQVVFTQHPGGFERRQRIAPQGEEVLRAHLYRNFHGRQLLILVGNDADFRHVSDVDAAQSYGRAHAQAADVIEVGFESDVGGKHADRSAHQEQEQRQEQTSNDHRDPNPKLRPLELLLARQKISS